jgi:hypothetical protein
MGKEADKGNICAAGRRVFEDPMQRREHSRLKVGALFRLLDVQMNSGHLVSRQMPQEDIHALLRSPQRGAITHFGYNEWRAAAGKAGRMPAHLDIRRLERARLRDHCDVEIANDPELLGRGQRRSRDETIDSVDRHSDESGYLLEDHVPAIERDAANPVLMRQDERRADVGMTRKRHLGARRKNPDTSGVCRIGRRQHESRLGKIELVGDGLHLSVGKTARIGNDRHRVAAELPIGEDIDRLK